VLAARFHCGGDRVARLTRADPAGGAADLNDVRVLDPAARAWFSAQLAEKAPNSKVLDPVPLKTYQV
jgi:hypothetical protein